jgi:hypothetical protein
VGPIGSSGSAAVAMASPVSEAISKTSNVA